MFVVRAFILKIKWLASILTLGDLTEFTSQPIRFAHRHVGPAPLLLRRTLVTMATTMFDSLGVPRQTTRNASDTKTPRLFYLSKHMRDILCELSKCWSYTVRKFLHEKLIKQTSYEASV